MLDFVSTLVSAVKKSLSHGTIQDNSFTLNLRTDVFNFLFNGKGTIVHGRRGYSLEDFDTDIFPKDWFVAYDKFGDGCRIDFSCLFT